MMKAALTALFIVSALQVAGLDLKAIAVRLAIPEVPSTCTSFCTGPQNILDNCVPTTQNSSCLCTGNIQVEIYNCLTCIGGAKNSTDFSLAQQDVDQVTSACDGLGTPLPKLTFPGQDPNRIIATAPVGTPLSPSALPESQTRGTGSINVSPSVTGIPNPSSSVNTNLPSSTNSQASPTSTSPAASGTSTGNNNNNNGVQQLKGWHSTVVAGVLLGGFMALV